jgi:hypothetical protein
MGNSYILGFCYLKGNAILGFCYFQGNATNLELRYLKEFLIF